MTGFTPHPAVDRFIAALGARIRHDETLPCGGRYDMRNDTVILKGSARDDVDYAILLHEHIHWTGHHTRLNRRFGSSRAGLEYGVEELTAIFGTIDLCTYFGLGRDAIDNQLWYAERFLPRMKHAAVMAGAQRQAKQAVAYLHRRAMSGTGDQPVFRSTAALAAMVLTKADARPPQPSQTAVFAHLRARQSASAQVAR